jgi:type III secretion system FlhB-like substrate exporter
MNWKVQAKQQFLNNRTPGHLKEIKVEEWGISVFYWPQLSMAEKEAVAVAYEGKNEHAAHVAQLIARARNEHGDPLFTERERDDLMMRYSPDVIERVSTQMMASEAPKVEDAEKNS